MKILVAFATERGGTEGLADSIGSDLRLRGHDVAVLPAHAVGSVVAYDAIILGGAIYRGHWHEDAVRFAHDHKAILRTRPTWLFSSGPLEVQAGRGTFPLIPQVHQALCDTGAIDAMTFGGRLASNPDDSYLARRKVERHGGDFRDPVSIHHWVDQIDATLRPALVTPQWAATG